MYKTFVFISLLAAAYGCGEPKSQTETISPSKVIVNANSYYMMTGDTFTADIIPVNSEQWEGNISFESGDGQITDSIWDKGILKIAIAEDRPGLKRYSGNLKYKSNKGNELLPFSVEYVVVEPVLSFRTKYLIKDIDNVVEIGITGIPPVFELTADNTDITGDFGQYTINPHKTGKLNLNVKSKDGLTDYGTFEFEVIEIK
jgi:hypothetical protein